MARKHHLGHLHLDSWALGLLGTWDLGYLGSWALGHLGSWTLGLLGTWALGHYGSWALGHLGSWALVFLRTCTWALGHLGSWALGLLGTCVLAHLYLGSWALELDTCVLFICKTKSRLRRRPCGLARHFKTDPTETVALCFGNAKTLQLTMKALWPGASFSAVELMTNR
jgi:hypothetical protein